MSMRLALLYTRLSKLAHAVRRPSLLSALVRHRVLAAAEHRTVLNGGFRTVVDIGANRGQFALAARQWAPEAKVISFEPLAKAAAVFRRVFQNDPLVTLHEAAIGAEKGDGILHVSGCDDSSSLLPIAPLQEKMFPGTGEVETQKVAVGRLADFVAADDVVVPAMLKLDVQGFELAVIEGCEELLPRFSYVYAECSFVELYSGQALADEIVAWLHGRGFKLVGVYNVCCDRKGRAIQGDFLFCADGSESRGMAP